MSPSSQKKLVALVNPIFMRQSKKNPHYSELAEKSPRTRLLYNGSEVNTRSKMYPAVWGQAVKI